MMNNLSVEALESLGIYELRNVARQVGVHLPTMYKKDELIKKIMAIVEGTEEPHIKKTNQGRPAKRISGLDEILNIFIPSIDDNQVYKKVETKNQFYPFSLMQDVKILPDHIDPFSGYVKMLDKYAVVLKNAYFEGNNDTYYIRPNILQELKLKNGDFVRGLYYDIDETKPKLVKNIEFINGKDVESFKRYEPVDFDSLDAIYPTSQIELGKNPRSNIDLKVVDRVSPIAEGSRVIINYENGVDIEEFLIDLNNEISLTQNKKLTMFAVDERPEDLSFVKSECSALKVFNKKIELNDEMFYEQMSLLFDNLIRQTENNANQIIIIKNAVKMENFLTKYFVMSKNCSEQEAKILAVDKMKNWFRTAKNTATGKALTIIMINCKNEELVELSNCQIFLKLFAHKGSDIHIDFEKSFTLKYNLILGAEKSKKLQEFRQNYDENNLIDNLTKLFADGK